MNKDENGGLQPGRDPDSIDAPQAALNRMREAAAGEGSRLLTFTLEADIGFAAPSDIEHFTGRLAEALAGLAREFPAGPARRVYRLTAAGHPAVGTPAESQPRHRIN